MPAGKPCVFMRLNFILFDNFPGNREKKLHIMQDKYNFMVVKMKYLLYNIQVLRILITMIGSITHVETK